MAKIATVRIAPVRYWCSELRNEAMTNPDWLRLVGMEIGIIVNSMIETEHSKGWEIEPVSREKMFAIIGRPPQDENDRMICEHMLEMD